LASNVRKTAAYPLRLWLPEHLRLSSVNDAVARLWGVNRSAAATDFSHFLLPLPRAARSTARSQRNTACCRPLGRTGRQGG
jgi:hypothetical protein